MKGIRIRPDRERKTDNTIVILLSASNNGVKIMLAIKGSRKKFFLRAGPLRKI